MKVRAGDEHTGSHSLPGLVELFDGLPAERKPALVRGDCGFGSDTMMRSLEERGQGCLFKLKLTKNVNGISNGYSARGAGPMPGRGARMGS
jgi:hypothetical protein